MRGEDRQDTKKMMKATQTMLSRPQPYKESMRRNTQRLHAGTTEDVASDSKQEESTGRKLRRFELTRTTNYDEFFKPVSAKNYKTEHKRR